MSTEWNEEKLRGYIENQIYESLTLDYKSAASLSKVGKPPIEITKDVSALANSAGGILIYGISEDTGQSPRPPKTIDPVNKHEITPEWLNQIILNISPRIDGVIIHPIQLSSNPSHVAYVVEVPQSTTAHMATDHKYYKRYNCASEPMHDHEVRDVMGRGRIPKIEIKAWVRFRTLMGIRFGSLKLEAKNNGLVYAQYVKVRFYLPPAIAKSHFTPMRTDMETIDGVDYFLIDKSNQKQDVMRRDDRGDWLSASWFDPLLPGQKHIWSWSLPNQLNGYCFQSDEAIRWEIFADHAIPKKDSVKLRDIEIKEDSYSLLAIFKTAFIQDRTRGILFLIATLFLLFLFVVWLISRLI